MSRQKHNKICSAYVNPPLVQAIDQIVDWMRQDVLPLWATMGIDRRLATAFSSLNLREEGGRIAPQPDVNAGWHGICQAQGVYVLSQAQHLGWLDIDESNLVKRMIEFSGRHGVLPCRSDGFVRHINPDLTVANGERLLLDHAYFMMASTASFVAYDVGNDLRRAYNIMHWIDIKMTHPSGGWCHAYQEPGQGSSETYLHCLEAFLYLFEVTRKSCWIERAGTVYDLFVERFFDPENFSVHRYIIDSETGLSKTAELAPPCQLFFWVWLLRRYQHHTGIMSGGLIEEICNQLYSKGKDFIRQTSPSHSSLLLSSYLLASSQQAQMGSVSGEEEILSAVGLLKQYVLLTPSKGWCSDKAPSKAFTTTRFFYLFEAVREAYLYLNPKKREVPLKEVGGL